MIKFVIQYTSIKKLETLETKNLLTVYKNNFTSANRIKTINEVHLQEVCQVMSTESSYSDSERMTFLI
jgi:hypothetical protein